MELTWSVGIIRLFTCLELSLKPDKWVGRCSGETFDSKTKTKKKQLMSIIQMINTISLQKWQLQGLQNVIEYYVLSIY